MNRILFVTLQVSVFLYFPFYVNTTFPYLTGTDEDKQLSRSEINFENKFGKSDFFVNSSITEESAVPSSSNQAALLREAIHVMSCSYEDKTLWGYEVLPT